MKKLMIAICDDDMIFGKRLKELVASYFLRKQLSCEIDVYQSGKEFVALKYKLNRYHIVFLDINMKEMDGIETARNLRHFNQETYLVFVTAFIGYTLEGYKVDAIRYILKTERNFEDLVYESLDAICEKMEYQPHVHLFDFLEGKKVISLEKIVYVESKLHKLYFYVIENEIAIYTMYNTLNHIARFFPEEFVRAHQSFLVNLEYVSEINRCELLLSEGMSIPLARSRIKEVNRKFISYKEKELGNKF